MESLEFLGGRYNRPEQIRSGPLQAFRAQNAANGRPVFIHRVSTAEAPEEQSALLKLLTAALVRSADAKRLVLDFGEERSFLYVVTDDAPQCAQLREWLQAELTSASSGGSRPSAAADNATKAIRRDPGEFMRFIQARAAALAALPTLQPSQMPVMPAEFTNLLKASGDERYIKPEPPPEPADPRPARAEAKPAHHNSYIQPPPLPAPPAPPAAPAIQAVQAVAEARPSQSPPPAPPAPKPVQSDLFGFAQPASPANDLSHDRLDGPFDDPFDSKLDIQMEVVQPLPPASQNGTEFNRVAAVVSGPAVPRVKPPDAMPGAAATATAAAAPAATAATAALTEDKPLLDDKESSESSSDSEFSQIMQGTYIPPKPPASRNVAASRPPPLSLAIAPKYMVVSQKSANKGLIVLLIILGAMIILAIRVILYLMKIR